MIAGLQKLRRSSGQVALETLVVVAIWLVVVIMFFNLLFVVSSLMLVQSSVNRISVQTGALGCYPADELKRDLDKNLVGFGVSEPTVSVRSWPEEDIANTGVLTRPPVSAVPVPTCQQRYGYGNSGPSPTPNEGNISDAELYALSGDYITITVTYKQNMLLFGTRTITRGASTVSARLEEKQ